MHNVKPSNRLPDGRRIRALGDTPNQKQMFGLHKSGLFDPATETIMNVIEHDQSLQSSAHESIPINGWWRTGDYGFYRCGFENEDIPLGKWLVYVEGSFSHILKIPDEPVTLPNGETIGLRRAVGMGVIRIEKLKLEQIDETTDQVSVTTDFDPKTDVKVVDIMRPRGWGLVDADGYPLRTKPSGRNTPEARCSHIRHSNEFDAGADGWHGSTIRGIKAFGYDTKRDVVAGVIWPLPSGVAAVSREGNSK